MCKFDYFVRNLLTHDVVAPPPPSWGWGRFLGEETGLGRTWVQGGRGDLASGRR